MLKHIIAFSAAACVVATAKAGLFGYRAFIVSTSSMEPEYKVNSLVIAESCPLDGVKPGDVIIFRSEALGGKPVCHRVFAAGNGIVTKGDKSKAFDKQAITRESYIGKCVFHTDLPSRYLSRIGTPAGAALFLWTPLLGCFLAVSARKFRPVPVSRPYKRTESAP